MMNGRKNVHLPGSMDPFFVAAVPRGVAALCIHMDLGCCSESLEHEDREEREVQEEAERTVCSRNSRVDAEGRAEQPLGE